MWAGGQEKGLLQGRQGTRYYWQGRGRQQGRAGALILNTATHSGGNSQKGGSQP